MDPFTIIMLIMLAVSLILGVVMAMQSPPDFSRGPAEFERPRIGEAESIPFARGTVDIRDAQVLYVGQATPVPVRAKP